MLLSDVIIFNAEQQSLIIPTQESPARFPRPLTLTWKLTHAGLFTIGGACFTVGSAAFTPDIHGWFFTSGGCFFVCTGFMEWWLNSKTGCLFDTLDEREAYERVVDQYFEDKRTWKGRYQRAEKGLSSFFALIGSIAMLIAAITWIPEINSDIGSYTAKWLFFSGAVTNLLAQLWKIYRGGCHKPDNLHDRSFDVKNWIVTFPAFIVDLTYGIGAGFYILGTLMELGVGTLPTNEAHIYNIYGGVAWTLSGLSLFYKYFHSNKDSSSVDFQ